MARSTTRLALLGATLAVAAYWYFFYFSLPKRPYNAVHPYTSFIAIFAYLVLRNLTAGLRKRHMHLFAWCGKITLETYILQFHVWMRTTGLNGSPKCVLASLLELSIAFHGLPSPSIAFHRLPSPSIALHHDGPQRLAQARPASTTRGTRPAHHGPAKPPGHAQPRATPANAPAAHTDDHRPPLSPRVPPPGI